MLRELTSEGQRIELGHLLPNYPLKCRNKTILKLALHLQKHNIPRWSSSKHKCNIYKLRHLKRYQYVRLPFKYYWMTEQRGLFLECFNFKMPTRLTQTDTRKRHWHTYRYENLRKGQSHYTKGNTWYAKYLLFFTDCFWGPVKLVPNTLIRFDVHGNMVARLVFNKPQKATRHSVACTDFQRLLGYTSKASIL